jgi:hypothetical protein
VEAPFKDPINIPVPGQEVTWKRPSEFLPVIPDLAGTASGASAFVLPPVIADPKKAAVAATAPAKKGGSGPSSSSSSKKSTETESAKKVFAPPPSKHAYVS